MKQNAMFEYQTVKRKNVEVVYENNILRVKTLGEVSFGFLTDLDGTKYESREI